MKREIFFVGIIIIFAGSLITIYDYPQLYHYYNLTNEEKSLLDIEIYEKFQRMQIEFAIGIALLGIGTVLSGYGMFKKP